MGNKASTMNSKLTQKLNANINNNNKTPIHPDIDTLNIVTYIQIVAADVITSTSFNDQIYLHNIDYCNKIAIVTGDVLKNSLTSQTINYLYNSINPDTNKPQTQLVENEKILYFNKDNVDSIDDDSDDKLAKCIGIAEHFVKIAHLFATINKNINPIFSYINKNSGETTYVPLQQKNNIPKGVQISINKFNLCTKRINAISPVQSKDGTQFHIKPKHCSINKNITNYSNKIKNNNDSNPSDNVFFDNNVKDGAIKVDDSIVQDKTLADENGIPELEQLYYDVYNYKTGLFYDMTGQAKTQYNNDLKTFYLAFSGKTIDQYNDNPPAKFSDIVLNDYHNHPMCKNNSSWNNNITGNTNSANFRKYANHITSMINNNNKQEELLLQQLKKVFEVNKVNEEFTVKIKDLDKIELQDIINDTRRIILEMYTQCEKDFKIGLTFIENIIVDRMRKTTELRIQKFRKDKQSLITNNRI